LFELGLVFAHPTVLVWDVKSGKLISKLAHPAGVLAVGISPDGQMIASGGADGVVRLWDPATKKEKWTLRGHTHTLSGVAFTADGRWVLTSALDSTIKVWESATGSLVRTLRGHTLGVTGLSLPANGRRLASSGVDGTIRVWDWERDQESSALETLGPTASLAFHPDGRDLASAGSEITLWDLATRKVVRNYSEGFINFNTMALAFSPDGRRLVTGGLSVKVWDTASGKKLFGDDLALFGQDDVSGDPRRGIIWGLAVSPDGKHVASSGVSIWDMATGKAVRRLATQGMSFSVAYSPDGKHVAGSAGHGVVLWDALSGDVVRKFPELPDIIFKVAFSLDGRRLLAVSNSSVRAWELPSGEEKLRFRFTSSHAPVGRMGINAGSVSFSADGRRLAIALVGEGTVAIWDVTRRQQILSLTIPTSQVVSVAFSPDGHWLAAAGLGGTKGILRIWDARPLAEK
jgi:WD40 repeat protein